MTRDEFRNKRVEAVHGNIDAIHPIRSVAIRDALVFFTDGVATGKGNDTIVLRYCGMGDKETLLMAVAGMGSMQWTCESP